MAAAAAAGGSSSGGTYGRVGVVAPPLPLTAQGHTPPGRRSLPQERLLTGEGIRKLVSPQRIGAGHAPP